MGQLLLGQPSYCLDAAITNLESNWFNTAKECFLLTQSLTEVWRGGWG